MIRQVLGLFLIPKEIRHYKEYQPCCLENPPKSCQKAIRIHCSQGTITQTVSKSLKFSKSKCRLWNKVWQLRKMVDIFLICTV